jgi:hypothetical protein
MTMATRNKAIALASLVLAATVAPPAFGQQQQQQQQQQQPPAFRDTIPPVVLFKEAARAAILMYEVDGIDSTALDIAETPLVLRSYHETSMGVEAAVIVGTQTKVIYLDIRGTDGEHEDTFVDSLFALVPLSLPGLAGRNLGLVHYGFQRALREALPALDAALKNATAAYPGYKVHIVGHSEGAALAHLYGFYAARTYLKRRNVRVVNVGQPRVGDLKMSQSVDATRNLALFRLVFEDGA